MTRIRFEGLSSSAFKNASAELSVGLWVVLAHRDDAAAKFARILAGLEKPVSGRLWFDRQLPYSTPAIRRQTAAVLPRENFEFATTVQRAIEWIGSFRKLNSSAEGVLSSLTLNDLAERPTTTLTPREARQLAMALAMTQTEPRFAILYEPLLALDGAKVARFQEWLSSASRRACVVCVTSSLSDAGLLGGHQARLTMRGWEPEAMHADDSRVHVVHLEGKNFRGLASRIAQVVPCHQLQLESTARGDALHVTGFSSDVSTKEIVVAARSTGARLSRIWTELGALTDPVGPPQASQNDSQPARSDDFAPRSAWAALGGEVRASWRRISAPSAITVLALEPTLAWIYGVSKRTQDSSWAGYDTLVFVGTILTPLWSLWISALIEPRRPDGALDAISRFGISRKIPAFARFLSASALAGLTSATAALLGTVGFSSGRAHAPAISELYQSSWIMALAGAVYGAIAMFLSSFKRRWLWCWAFILLDLILGGTSRSVAFPFPRAHIHNLLGSPSSIELLQRASCVYLGCLLVLAVGLTLAKTEP